jgi:ferredoxin
MSDVTEPTLRVAVRIEPLGAVFEASAQVPVLLSARAAGVVLPVSCRNGTCRTCLCRATSGHVGYRIEWPGLSAEEKAEGYLLPCVAYPLSDLVLQAPAAQSQG